MTNTNSIKGFQDYKGLEAWKRENVKNIISETFKTYGYEPAETPTIEREEFVTGENAGDEAVSEVYKLEDRGKRKLALRYEFTFQLKRIAQQQKLPYKRYQIGNVFRDEPTKTNRWREFTQADADIIGSNPNYETELLAMITEILAKLGIEAEINVNNRRLLNEILIEQNIEEKNRETIIRIIDKLDKKTKKEVADELQPYKAEKVLNIITKGQATFKQYNYYKEIEELKKKTAAQGITINFQPTLARGLSYYNGTIFEVKTKKMKETICAGGAYKIGEAQAFGISLGIDRITTLTNLPITKTNTIIINLEQEEKTNNIAKKLREKGIYTDILYDKTISKALEYANSKKYKKAIIIGKKEKENNNYTIKNLENGKEETKKEKELLELLQDKNL